MRITSPEWCENCTRYGHGTFECPYYDCDVCDGTGRIDCIDADNDDHEDYNCPRCDDGTFACVDCDGKGYLYQAATPTTEEPCSCDNRHPDDDSPFEHHPFCIVGHREANPHY